MGSWLAFLTIAPPGGSGVEAVISAACSAAVLSENAYAPSTATG